MIPPLANSVLDLIGGTPLLELRRVVSSLGLEGRLLAKLEDRNPGQSKKDRAALEIIRTARSDGSLRPGQTVVEMTSGNMGAGLAIVCGAMGHPFVAVMSKGNSVERRLQMEALGAEVVLVEQAEGSTPGMVSGADLALVDREAAAVQAERDAFRASQFDREANAEAHERGTGPEIWEQSRGTVEVFVDMPGTSGSFTGITRALKRRNRAIRSYVVEPASAPVLAGGTIEDAGHRLQGAGYARSDLPLFDKTLADGFLAVEDRDAIAAARLLAREEGILGGFTSGAHLSCAIRLLQDRERGATIAFLVCDSGLKYLSTDLFSDAPS